MHGITTERAEAEGVDLDRCTGGVWRDLDQAEYVMGHNISFDVSIMGAEWIRRGASAERVTGKAVDRLQRRGHRISAPFPEAGAAGSNGPP